MKLARLCMTAILMLLFGRRASTGKHNFCQMIAQVRREFGQVTGKVSSSQCRRFDRREKYSGIVIYQLDGKFKFRYPAHHWGGRFFHVSIEKVSSWPQGAVHRRAGQGMVHDFHHKSFTGLDFQSGRTCSGGFSIQEGVIKYSSLWLNPKASSGCVSDGSGIMSAVEQAFLNPLIEAWMRGSCGYVHTFGDSFLRRHCSSDL